MWTPWAKRERGVPHGPELALFDHCLDVAVVLEALLRSDLRRWHLAHLAGLDDLTPGQQQQLCVFAGLHDLGKANLGFQDRATLGASPWAGHVSEALALLEDGGTLGDRAMAVLDPVLDWEPDGEPAYVRASIQHHGGPVPNRVPPLTAARLRSLWSPRDGRDPLAAVESLLRDLQRAFPDTAGQPLPDSPALQHAFAGWLMLADWLGSDDRVFRFTLDCHGRRPPTGLDRLPWSRARASELLFRVGLDAPSFATRDTQGAILGSWSPRSAQRAVLELELPSEPSTLLVEADTGSGKTEAALLHWARLRQAGLVDGLYFAVPTRAAASQLYGRVRDAATRLWGGAPPAVLLAVPGYSTSDSDAPELLPSPSVRWEVQGDSTGPYLEGWAGEHPKRFLAAGVAVGTVDQVLLSALNVNHSRMRASSLLRQLLVVDEVHASDTYMGALLGQVLRRHRAAGGHAVLLSATLGAAARAELLEQGAVPEQLACERADYPLVSYRVGATELQLAPPAVAGRRRTVTLAPRSAGSPDAMARRALELASRGARVLVLRNTVTSCVATQLALEDLGAGLLSLQAGSVPVPHHGRYAPADRRSLDRAVEAALGKGAPARPVIVVATQTVEQSLDLDADVLLTDLAPADVLIQRLGRIHRHAREGRARGFEAPRCEVWGPADGELLAWAAGEGRRRDGWGAVYEDLRVLRLTWDLVRSRPEWILPDDNRLLVERSTHPEALASLTELAWEDHARKLLGAELAQRRHARDSLADWSHGFDDEDLRPVRRDERLTTRLGEQDRELTFAEPFVSPLGATVHRLRVPAWMVQGIALADEGVATWRPTPGGVAITSGEGHFVYTRFGLEAVRS